MRDSERVKILEAELIHLAEMVAGTYFINAIKAYRAATGASLVESKAHIEQFRTPPAINPLVATVERLERRVVALEQASL